MNRKKTALYIGPFELPDRNAAALRVLSNGKLLRGLGWNVVFCGADKSQPLTRDIPGKADCAADGFECYTYGYPTGVSQWLRYLSGAFFSDGILDKTEDLRLVIGYNLPALLYEKLRRLCRRRGIKLISDCTEWYSTRGAPLLYKLVKGLDSFIRMRFTHFRLDGMIVVSTYLMQYYRKMPCLLLPPLVDCSEPKWNEPVGRHSGNEVRFVYSGNPGIGKDELPILVQGFGDADISPERTLTVAGISREDYIARYGGIPSARVYFAGRVSHRESLQLLRKADYAVFLRDDTRSNRAGFPTKYVEAVTCGAGVLTNRCGDTELYADSGEVILLAGPDPIWLRKAIRTIKPSPRVQTRSRMFHYSGYTEAAQQFLEKVFNARSTDRRGLFILHPRPKTFHK